MTTPTSNSDSTTSGHHKPPRLLVSVRSKMEAFEALAGGVDILDIKEPANGSLGMADLNVVREIADLVRREAAAVPVSVALGELTDWTDLHQVISLPPAVKFAKVGLSGLSGLPDWRHRWRSFRNRCDDRRDQSIKWVAVAYADALKASSPNLQEVLQAAIETNCAGLLIDTFGKDTKSLIDHVSASQLCEIAKECRRGRIFLAIAGRLTAEALSDFSECQPDILAIRSAACRHGDRQDSVEASCVASFRDAIRRNNLRVDRVAT